MCYRWAFKWRLAIVVFILEPMRVLRRATFAAGTVRNANAAKWATGREEV
jgi:hypothetical protein